MRRTVLDTNVIVAALRSRRGRSNRLLGMIGEDRFQAVVSVPLVLESEDAVMRNLDALRHDADEIGEILDFICWAAEPVSIYYLWRPLLPDPKDDMVLEAAVAGQCGTIVTFNRRDFRGAETVGIRISTPREFLEELET